MYAAAGPAVPQPHSRTAALDRIDLREEACMGGGAGASLGMGEADALGNGPPMASLPEISEDGAEGAAEDACLTCMLPAFAISAFIAKQPDPLGKHDPMSWIWASEAYACQ